MRSSTAWVPRATVTFMTYLRRSGVSSALIEGTWFAWSSRDTVERNAGSWSDYSIGICCFQPLRQSIFDVRRFKHVLRRIAQGLNALWSFKSCFFLYKKNRRVCASIFVLAVSCLNAIQPEMFDSLQEFTMNLRLNSLRFSDSVKMWRFKQHHLSH